MWTLLSLVVLLAVWGMMWRSQPKLAFGVLLGLPVAWIASRLTAPYFRGEAEIPIWLPPLPPATVAVLLFVFGTIVWLRADRLPPPVIRDAHGSHGAHGGDSHSAHAPERGAEAGGGAHGAAAAAAGVDSGDDLASALELARAFVGQRISAAEFVSQYRVVWRRLRHSNRLATANPYLQRALKVVLESVEAAADAAAGAGGASAAADEKVSRELELRVATALGIVDHVH